MAASGKLSQAALHNDAAMSEQLQKCKKNTGTGRFRCFL